MGIGWTDEGIGADFSETHFWGVQFWETGQETEQEAGLETGLENPYRPSTISRRVRG
jgi:hypothetical protein